jgi:phospholipid N-methyltransferase
VLDRLPRGGELLVIDTNPLFIDYLKHEIRDSRFHPVLGSAEDVEEIVRSLGTITPTTCCRACRSRPCPMASARPSLGTYRVVRPGGAFLTYQFSTVARDLTARHFERVDTGFTWLNIPPCLLAWGWKALPATA